ncbi:MAG: hypothetical protein ACM3UU_07055 [Ignavibacteriales bacterium]
MEVLLDDIIKKIELDYSDSKEIVISLLESFIYNFKLIYGFRPDSRIVRCILFLSDTKMEYIKHYIALSEKDWRDVIYQAEYDNFDRKVHDFNKAFNF